MPSDINDDLPKEHQEAIKRLVDEFDNKGVAVSLQPDGAMFVFSRAYLQKLLDSMPTQNRFAMYIKRPGVN